MNIIMLQLGKDDTHVLVKLYGDKVLLVLLKEFGQLHKYDILIHS